MMRYIALLTAIFGSAVLAACSSNVSMLNTGGSGGDGSTGSSGTGDAGSTGSSGTDGGYVSCPSGAFFKTTIAHNGVVLAKNDGGLMMGGPTLTVQGALTMKGPGSFEIDACANVDCKMPDVYQVTLDTAGIPVEIPEGTYVELAYQALVFGGEPQVGYAAWIRNIPSLGGIANPTEAGNGLWVEGVVGFADAGAPVRTTCPWIDEATCTDSGKNRIVDLSLNAADDASKSIRLSMGETKTWSAATAALPGSYTAKNLSSKLQLFGMWDLSFVVARSSP